MSLITSTCNTKYLEERILILVFTCSEVTAHKKSDDFWLPGGESFLVYNMNGFAAIIFTRYYTLSYSLIETSITLMESSSLDRSKLERLFSAKVSVL